MWTLILMGLGVVALVVVLPMLLWFDVVQPILEKHWPHLFFTE
jgi:hypothetical protein